MSGEKTMSEWIPSVVRGNGPLYLAIADALEADIDSGVLRHGFRLPAQRALASKLEIDFTTVSRAYTEAQRRGLVEGRVGQGTYIKGKPQRAAIATAKTSTRSSGIVDMAMNLPPRFSDGSLETKMWAAVAGLEQSAGLDLILRYQEVGGTHEDREAGAAWLSDRLPGISADRVILVPGAQAALLAITTMLLSNESTVAVESLTYPGLKAIAAHMGRQLAPIEMDASGIIPESFAEICRTRAPSLLYCTPTLHNPTTSTLPLERREAIIEIARGHGVRILEDDAYGKLSGSPIPPLAALAPDITYHVAGLSKCLSPALRIAYVVPPSAHETSRLISTVRAMTSIASPISAAIATAWIKDGLADSALAAIRAETEARRSLAMEVLAPLGLRSAPNAFHGWLPMQNGWTRSEFSNRLRNVGIGVVTSDAFAVSAPPEAVRLGFGPAPNRDQFSSSVRTIANLILEMPELSSIVI